MRLYLLLLFFIIGTVRLSAQRFLQMERSGTYKVKRYYPGQEITFRIAGDPDWYTEEIEEILVDDGMVVFSHRAIEVENISHIRSFQRRRWSKPIGRQLYNFGLGWLVFSLGSALVGTPLTAAVIVVPAISGVTGFLIQKIFRRRTFKMNENRRLRLLDLTFKPISGP